MTGDYDMKSLVEAHRMMRDTFNREADAILAGARLSVSQRILTLLLASDFPRLDLSHVIADAYYQGQLDELRRRKA